MSGARGLGRRRQEEQVKGFLQWGGDAAAQCNSQLDQKQQAKQDLRGQSAAAAVQQQCVLYSKCHVHAPSP